VLDEGTYHDKASINSTGLAVDFAPPVAWTVAFSACVHTGLGCKLAVEVESQFN
jgi:hypothetical protein